MNILPAELDILEETLAILRSGGVVAMASDAGYVFIGDAGNPDAVTKIFALKKRPRSHPIATLFSTMEESMEYTQWSVDAYQTIQNHLPGALISVLPLKQSLTSMIYATPEGAGTIGVRVTSYLLLAKIVALFGSPLACTAARLEGQPLCYNVSELVKQFGTSPVEPDLVVDCGELPKLDACTVVDMRIDAEKALVRQGMVKVEL
jgi:L-threonylcarbamoyladenylate synthase